MEFIYGLSNLRKKHKNCAATIGNFDGVHLGHQIVLKQLIAISESNNLVSTVVILHRLRFEYYNCRY